MGELTAEDIREAAEVIRDLVGRTGSGVPMTGIMNMGDYAVRFRKDGTYDILPYPVRISTVD